MFKWVYRLLAVMAIASTARAGVVVELVPDNPGPYYGGESLTVDVWLHSDVDYDVRLQMVRFDFSNTAPSLGLHDTLTFDLTSIPGDINGYLQYYFPDLPLPWIANTLECLCPELFLQLPGGGFLHAGNLPLVLPVDPGLYSLDALNSGEPDELLGAAIITAYGPPGFPEEFWRAYTGEITGGTYDFVVIPEPATLVLVAFGVLTSRRDGGCRDSRLTVESYM